MASSVSKTEVTLDQNNYLKIMIFLEVNFVKVRSVKNKFGFDMLSVIFVFLRNKTVRRRMVLLTKISDAPVLHIISNVTT